MAKLPQGWVECLIKDIAKNIQYGYTESANVAKIGPRFLRITDIQNDNVNWDLVPYCKIDDNIKSKYLLENGDFVFARTGATVGKSYLIDNLKEEAVYASYLIRIRFYDISFTKYVKYYFQTSNYWNQISENKVGIGQPNVNGTVLSNLKIPFPPLNEQRRIVEKIESEFAKIDEGLEHLEQAKVQIKQYRQSVLKSAFEGKLTQHNPDDESAEILLQKINPKAKFIHNDKLPQGWIECLLGEVCEVITGATPSTKNDNNYNNKDYPFFKPTDLNAGYFTNDSKEYVSAYAYNRARKLPKNSVLVTCIGATIGKTGIIRQAGICNQQINAILPNNYILPELLYWYCISEHFQNLIKVTASATTLPILNKSNFEKLYIVLMPLNEQKQIVEEIEKRFAVADEVEKVVEENIEKAKQLKQSILKKAFEGRLVPQDPTDEPASILLEKIKQERSKK